MRVVEMVVLLAAAKAVCWVVAWVVVMDDS